MTSMGRFPFLAESIGVEPAVLALMSLSTLLGFKLCTIDAGDLCGLCAGCCGLLVSVGSEEARVRIGVCLAQSTISREIL